MLKRPSEVAAIESDDRGAAYRPYILFSLLAILSLAAAFRLYRISSLFPILVDESIYLRWAEIIDHRGQWFISLLDAKQPLSFWIYAILRKVFPGADPLLSARLVSVLAGVVSAAFLFALGRQLAGARAGLATAFFYAVLPFGVFYEHLAYTDGLLNTFGIATTWASVRYFVSPHSRLQGAMLPGLLLGLGFFVKSTMAVLFGVPVAAALIGAPRNFRLVAPRLAVIYGIAAIFPLVSFTMIPVAPTFEVNNLLFHHSDYFTPVAVLFAHPFVNLPRNLMLVGYFFSCYVTTGFSILIFASLLYTIWRRNRVLWLVLAAFAAPVSFEILALEYFPSRYLFPLSWVLLLIVGITVAELLRDRVAYGQYALVVVASVPLLMASGTILTHPEKQVDAVANVEFLSSGPYSGYGIREAVDWLKGQTTAGPITVLTDPIWGPPADAIYPYLNLWHGSRVYDAWWLQLPGEGSILPSTPTEVMESQYERVSAGVVDFPSLPSVYYVTDTNYHKSDDVEKRDPTARLVARFLKRNGTDSIDIYRLR